MHRIPLRPSLLVLGIVTALPAAASAQGGLLEDMRTQYTMITGPGEGGHHGALQAIVLWRGEPGWENVRTPSERQRIDSVFRWGQLRASEAHESFFGNGLAYGLATEDHQELIIEGRHFLLHGGDSTLVIMVQVLPNDLPRVVTTTHIRSAAIPESFWSKSWTSGDTTYFVHPHYPESVRMLRSALLESPAAAEFLR